MKTRRRPAPRTRPIAAALILAATAFLLLGRNAGILGALLSAATTRLLGAAGTGLLVVTAWTLAFILATPPGTLTQLVVALWRACTVPSRHTVTERAVRGGGVDAGVGATVPAPAPRDRRKLDSVRDAMKDLGYKKHEYEPLVAQMDPSQDFEKLVRGALKALQVN